MASVPLREYLAQIENWTRSGDPARAIAHGRHLLAHHPECLWIHRTLGEAYLDMGMLAEARESFRRTLAADPENAIAHIGLSLAYDRQGMLPEAICHMERAFDLASGNAEVRTELQSLYRRRGDSRTSAPALTRAAMARVYAHNGLPERAIAEYEEALQQNPDLPGVRAGLAEVQWKAGHHREAVETCRRLLQELPGCVKALLIVGQSQLEAEQGPEAESYLTKAQALDPENRLAQAMMGELSPLPRTEVLVEVLPEEGAPMRVSGDEGDRMMDKEEGAGEALPGQEKGLSGERAVSDQGESAGGRGTISPEGADAPSSGEAGPRDEAVPGEEQAPPGAGAGLPDEAEIPLEEQASPPELPEDVAAPPGEPPGWLQELPPDKALAGLASEGEEGDEGGPEWLEPYNASLVEEQEEQPGAEGMPADQPEPPAWMRTLAEQTVADEEPVVPRPAPRDEALRQPATASDAETESGTAATGGVGKVVPDWVRRMEEAVTEESVPMGADVLGAAGVAAVSTEDHPAPGSSTERQRIRDLALLLRREPGKYWARIELARMCRLVGDWDGALLQYEELIAGHKMIRAVIEDLQGLLQEEETDRVQVYRLLGDAYMESDQIDQALEMYRLARQILRKR